MRKDQCYLDTDSEVQFWDGEINEDYVSVYVERLVEVEVNLDEAGEVDYVEATSMHM